jgi:hypothetical protein
MMKQGLFEVFGPGQLGLKAADLNSHAELIDDVGLSIPEGIVIATGIFDQLTAQINFEEPLAEIKKHNCPDFLLAINEKILDKLEIGTPYAIRSSALSERGGTGIYKTEFFLPTGNRAMDLQNLWHCEASVYASEFTSDAQLWRDKNNAPIGMAILIQPVVGFHLNGDFLPALAGVAYTSYNGLPTVRVVVGLGTQAVNGGGIIYNYPSSDVQHFQREMSDQKLVEAISPEAAICKINTHCSEVYAEIARGFKAFQGLFDTLSQLQKHGNFYLEWAISNDRMNVVQCASYEDRLPGNVPFDSTDYFLLLQGNDVLHSGQATCKGIVYVDKWSSETSQVVELLNKAVKGYLLIVPQDALSLLADIYGQNRFSYRHFSNTFAVVEKQQKYTIDQRIGMLQEGMHQACHSEGQGASHFSQLCNRADILFIGSEFDSTLLFALPGGMDYGGNIGITIWNTVAEVTVDTIKKEGCVYIFKKSKKSNYSFHQLQAWCFALRLAANSIGPDESEMADHFYAIHEITIPEDNPVEFDPFKLDETAAADFGGVAGIVESLKVVIANGERWVNNSVWNGGLKIYLEELLIHLQ